MCPGLPFWQNKPLKNQHLLHACQACSQSLVKDYAFPSADQLVCISACEESQRQRVYPNARSLVCTAYTNGSSAQCLPGVPNVDLQMGHEIIIFNDMGAC